MEIVGKKRFLHHYNFPPYCAGEVRRLGSPGRREIGHGALAEKALRTLIPEREKFPYTIRIVSEVLSSNGSTSMGSVCAASLALFDAGVPIKRSVAGISCGLIMEEDESKSISQRDYKILTDIQGPEDHLGDMDLKIAGTKEGITAIQLDVKIKGLTSEILKEGFKRAKKARQEILEKMNEALPKPRPEVSPLAPKIFTIKINPEKIGEVIGAGGKIINEIIDKTDSSIEIEDDGLIFVTAKNEEMAQKAIDWIYNLTREIKVGETFQGKVKKIVDFGLFVELLPNREGLLHISEISPTYQSKNDLIRKFKIGEVLPVKVKNIDEGGKISLVLLPGAEVNNPPFKYGTFQKRFRR
jgi:polyribonucleotide nucleotidyltransferase